MKCIHFPEIFKIYKYISDREQVKVQIINRTNQGFSIHLKPKELDFCNLTSRLNIPRYKLVNGKWKLK